MQSHAISKSENKNKSLWHYAEKFIATTKLTVKTYLASAWLKILASHSTFMTFGSAPQCKVQREPTF